MKTAISYLHSLAHALANMQLYSVGHPARAHVVNQSFGRLRELLRADNSPSFSFIEGAVIYGNLPVHDMRDWPWSRRLPDLGVQRLEFDQVVPRSAYGMFLDDLVSRIASEVTTDEPPPIREGIRFGLMRVTGDDVDEDEPGEGTPAVATLPYRLSEEADTVQWLYRRAGQNEDLPLTEVEAVVRSLMVAMRADGQLALPLVDMNDVDQYSSQHAINVAMLAMTVGESLGMSSRDVRAFGTAGLLHDIGMTKVPPDLLHKESLTKEDWEQLYHHPAAGARMLLQKNDEHEIAAIAAYEHHARPDGSGYPRLRFPRDHHYVSKVVAVCDAYDALRAQKSYRDAWNPDEVLQHIEAGAGHLFDHAVATTFVAIIRRLTEEKRLAGVSESARLTAGDETPSEDSRVTDEQAPAPIPADDERQEACEATAFSKGRG